MSRRTYFGLTKCETSAICTPTSKVPSSSLLICRASSRSRAVSGSIVNTLHDLKSFLASISVCGIAQGVGGRHFATLSEKLWTIGNTGISSVLANLRKGFAVTYVSSVKPQSLRRALLSASRFPISPNSSTREPKGWSEVIGHLLIHATNRVLT